jgi:hypothetical protein
MSNNQTTTSTLSVTTHPLARWALAYPSHVFSCQRRRSVVLSSTGSIQRVNRRFRLLPGNWVFLYFRLFPSYGALYPYSFERGYLSLPDNSFSSLQIKRPLDCINFQFLSNNLILYKRCLLPTIKCSNVSILPGVETFALCLI